MSNGVSVLIVAFLMLSTFEIGLERACAAAAGDDRASVIVLRGARVVDVRRGEASEPSDVLIRGGRIASIGDIADPAGATVIDAREGTSSPA
ncbi:MAG: hypothetical protein AAFQ71_09640 [Planctomycetota bacterium]